MKKVFLEDLHPKSLFGKEKSKFINREVIIKGKLQAFPYSTDYVVAEVIFQDTGEWYPFFGAKFRYEQKDPDWRV